MVNNQSRYKDFVNDVLIPTLCYTHVSDEQKKKRDTPFLQDKLDMLKLMITGEH